MGFPSGGDFVLVRAAELGLLLLGCTQSFLLTPRLCPPPPPLNTQSGGIGEKKRLHFVFSCGALPVGC